jgi:hypothetical protein
MLALLSDGPQMKMNAERKTSENSCLRLSIITCYGMDTLHDLSGLLDSVSSQNTVNGFSRLG